MPAVQKTSNQGIPLVSLILFTASLTCTTQCDKAQPACSRCVRAQRKCQYEVTTSPQQQLHGLSAAVAESVLGLPRGNAIPFGTLLSHVSVIPPTGVFPLMVPLSPSIWHLSCQYPHLLSAILAVSACHLSHTTPNASAYRIAECELTSTALGLFRSAIGQPLGSLSGSDAALLTSMMLNTLAFAAVDRVDDPTASWVFSDDENRLDWLELQLGLKTLLLATRPFRSGSILHPVFAASELGHRDLSTSQDGRDGDSMLRFIPDPDSVSGQKDLVEPVTILAQIRGFPPSPEHIFRYVQFIRTVEPRFIRRLYCRDERALWIFGHWLGLISRIPGMWWCMKRAQRDRAAIRDLLQRSGVCEREGMEGFVWKQWMEEY